MGVLFVATACTTTGQQAHTVEYKVTGTAYSALLSYDDGQGGTEAVNDAELPWSKTLTGIEAGVPLFISAQNDADMGDVVCEIMVDGKSIKKSQVEGGFGLATCEGKAGE